jgi:Protein of unknown function (DUF3293)
MQTPSFPSADLRMAFEHAVYEVIFPEGPLEFSAGVEGPGAPSFTIVTAWNPSGAELCLDENVARNAGFLAVIRARGWRWLPAENRAPDGSHVESGYAILDVPVGDVATLAAQFGQLAAFVWDGSKGRLAWFDSYGLSPTR